jgi:hypothetical protein
VLTAPHEFWTPVGEVRGPLEEAEAHVLAARSQAMIADPRPLGLGAFAATTWVISTVIAGWESMAALAVVIPIALFFGGGAQFLAGMWAFRRGNTLAATAFSSFGAFNVAFGAWLLLTAAHLLPVSQGNGQSAAVVAGWFIITFGVVAGYLALASLAESGVLFLILATLTVTYVLDGIGVMIGGNNWVAYIGGYFGLLSALIAFYLSAAIVINASFGREIFPMFEVGAPPRAATHPVARRP